MTSATSEKAITDSAVGLDIADTQFSRRDRWLSLALQPETGRGGLYLCTTRENMVHRTMLRIELEQRCSAQIFPAID